MISIIIPFYNEKDTIEPLVDEIAQVFKGIGREYEIVFADDGSDDGSGAIAAKLARTHANIRLSSLRRRLGKGAALSAAISESQGDILIFMDADLQDAPSDIPSFLKKIEKGYDLVNGIRTSRQDNGVIKIYSKIGNWFLRAFVRSPFTDINCGFKALKKYILDDITLYSNNFRFLPVAAYLRGFKVAEVSVHNRPRIYGRSKFGIGKVFTGFIDTFTAYFLYTFAERPLHFFGSVGAGFFTLGFVIALYLSIQHIFFGVLLYKRPVLQLAALLIVVGIQILMTGILGELIVYIHKKKNPQI